MATYKKSGGTSIRSYLSPHYKTVDREKTPSNFIQSEKKFHNDILNNYRICLGEYQFKRALFAKKYLYKENWENIYSFAFSREPVSRTVSMFYYLYFRTDNIKKLIRKYYLDIVNFNKIGISTEYSFDIFLDMISKSRYSDSFFTPFGLHFSTHTANMWDDITDHENNVLIKNIYRLDDLEKSIKTIANDCNLEFYVDNKILLNAQNKNKYIPNKNQKLKIERLFSNDFNLYESI